MEPSDGATTRKNRLLDMLRHVQSMEPDGLSHSEIVDYLEMMHGLTPRTGGAYVQRMIAKGILRPMGQVLHLNETGFNQWMEILGYQAPSIQVQCLGCGAVYSNKIPECPECGGLDRKRWRSERDE